MLTNLFIYYIEDVWIISDSLSTFNLVYTKSVWYSIFDGRQLFKESLAWKYRIVPHSSPWVSEDA